MLSKTHMAVGLSAALTFCAPGKGRSLAPVLLGAAVGSLICDIDCKREDRNRKDVLYGRVLGGILIAGALWLDASSGGGVTRFLREEAAWRMGAGLLLFVICAMAAAYSVHRGFSHSLLAMALYSLSLVLFLKPVVPAFAVSYLTHLALDLLNKKPLRLLYPSRKGYCLKLCRADRLGNTLCLAGGCLWLVWRLCTLYA